MRFAIYYTPERNHPLTIAAGRWLGRDAFGGAVGPRDALGGLSAEEIDRQTASASRYGFHATLKAPFELATGVTPDDLEAALAAYARTVDPVSLGHLVLKQMDGFFALVESKKRPQLQTLAADIVRAFDRFRAPLSGADIARRNPEGLTPEELHNLTQWGYPYVFDTFRFHMTLTGRAFGKESESLRRILQNMLGDLLDTPLMLDGLALFVEPEPGAPFVVRSYHALGRDDDRQPARISPKDRT
jgi:putative phosphonate metabolism protein